MGSRIALYKRLLKIIIYGLLPCWLIARLTLNKFIGDGDALVMENTLFQQGVELMIFGMGTVFVFLTVLILLTTAMSSLVGRFFPVEAPPSLPVKQVPSAVSAVEDERLLAVISASIHRYRSRHNK